MKDSTTAPVAIFAFNRPEKLRRLIESLHRCDFVDRTRFVFFIDGPRHERDRALVEEVRAVAEDSGFAALEVRANESNKGLRRSVFDGVSSLIETHGRAIVLEDDLVLSPIALRYFNEALDFYEPYTRVWSICGFVWDTPELRKGQRALVLPFGHPWGWATWRRAWDMFELDARPSDENLRSPTFRGMFDVNGLFPFTRILSSSIRGLVSSWYAHWNYTIFVHGGCSIFPPRRVLGNIGIGKGTHGGPLNPHNHLLKAPEVLEFVPEMHEPTEIDFAALDHMRRSREVRLQRAIILGGQLKRTFKARLKRRR